MRNIDTVFRLAALFAAGMGFLVSGSALAQTPEMEYQWGEGLHQEEWYDPSDWFDSEAGIDYETDWWEATYGYDYDEPYEEEGIFGYYDDNEFGHDDRRYGDDDYHRYDYYTDTWYDKSPYEAWYE